MSTITTSARVWIYQSNRKLNAEECQYVDQSLKSFVQEWNAHGNALTASYDLREPFHFALIVDESKTSASGCSIDSSIKVIKQMEAALQVDFFQRQNIVFKAHDTVNILPMQDFISKVKSGDLDKNTPIADTLVNKYGDWENNFFKPAIDSWLGVRL